MATTFILESWGTRDANGELTTVDHEELGRLEDGVLMESFRADDTYLRDWLTHRGADLGEGEECGQNFEQVHVIAPEKTLIEIMLTFF